MVEKQSGTLLSALLGDAVFHRDSVVLYHDRSWSMGVANNGKQVAQIFPVDAFDGRAQALEKTLTQKHYLSRASTMALIRDVKKALVDRRGGELAFHYSRPERAMLQGAAALAAREPEAAVLYAQGCKDGQKLRMLICPDEDIIGGLDGASTRHRGAILPDYATVIVAHGPDQKKSKTTLHEMVHAYDLAKGGISDRLPDGLLERVQEQQAWLLDTYHKIHHPDQMTQEQRDFVAQWRGWVEIVGAQADTVFYDPVAVLGRVVNRMEALRQLPEDMYPTPEAKRAELIPLYEELVGSLTHDRLRDTAGRKLMEVAFPELGAFVKEHYVAPLEQDYAKVLESGRFAMKGADIERPGVTTRLMTGSHKLMLRPEKDAKFRWSERDRSTLKDLRETLQEIALQEANYGLQYKDQVQEDAVMEKLVALYRTKCDGKIAELMALEEFDAVHKATRSAQPPGSLFRH